jgi:hypothetical protein
MRTDELRTALIQARQRADHGRKDFQEVVRACLSRMQVDGQVLEILAEVGGVNWLDLRLRILDDGHAAKLASLQELSELSLAATPVSTAIVRELAKLDRLTSLDLSDCAVKPGALADLARGASLTVLKLRGCALAEEDFSTISRLSHLSELDLAHSNVTDADVERLAALTRMSAMRLAKTRVSGKGLRLLRGLRDLRILDVRGMVLDDGDLDCIFGFPELDELGIANTAVSCQELISKLMHSTLSVLIVDAVQMRDLRSQRIQPSLLLSD